MRVKVDGLRELEAALAELPKTTGKAVLRRVLKKAGQPIAEAASSAAARGTGELAGSAAVSTKLSKRQRSRHRKMFKNDKASVEVFAGFGPLPQAHQQEFGNARHGPQPAMRPAWDAEKMNALRVIEDNLGEEIDKAVQRLARKAARNKA